MSIEVYPAEIIAKINELDTRQTTQEGLALRSLDLINAIEKRVAVNEGHLTKAKLSFDDITSKLGQINIKTEGMETAITTNSDDIDVLSASNCKLQGDNDINCDKLQRMEVKERRKVLVIEGIPEDRPKSLRDTVDQLFNDLKLPYDNSIVESAYRRGKKQVPPPSAVEGRRILEGLQISNQDQDK